MVAKMRARGNRLTPQRLALLHILADSTGHPSAGELHERISEHFPTTSPATVYKTLALLREMGEVFEIGFSDYDNRYDGNRPDPHPHLICVHCHSVIDAHDGALAEMSRRLQESYDQHEGYRVLSHRLDLLGLCPRCQEELRSGSVALGDSLARTEDQSAGV